jgi:hypothetical protein
MSNATVFQGSAWQRTVAIIFVAGCFVAAACNLFAQTVVRWPDSEAALFERMKQEGAKGQSKDAKPPGPLDLEDAMAKALKNNSEIRLAEAKVRAAEAELDRVQQQVLAKILVTTAELKGSRAILAETQRRLENLKRLRASGNGAVSDLEIGDASTAVAKYSGDVDSKQAELDVLMGNLPVANRLPLSRAAHEPPPILKTYQVHNQNAADLAKVLQGIYKESATFRLTPIGTNQLMAYAPAAVQEDIAKAIAASSGIAGRVTEVPAVLKDPGFIRAMGKTVKINFTQNESVRAVLDFLSQSTKDEGVNLLLFAGKPPVDEMPAITLSQPINVAAALLLIEDSTNIRFVVRDYGVVGMRSDAIPSDAVLLRDIVKQMPSKPFGKQKEQGK